MDKQYGGWYDNPATGRNQRWFNGTWTDGSEPGAGGYAAGYQANYDLIAGEVNKYADELVKFAQDDFDFASKWIEQQYKEALGTDDASRAEFFKKVANSLEDKVGRIAFDHQTGTYRLEQDATREGARTASATEQALKRLAEDEQVFREQHERDRETDMRGTAEGLNARGILSGDPNETSGLAGRVIRERSQEHDDRLAAFERLAGRDRDDITTQGQYAQEDIQRGLTRGLEDLTTSARRGAQDEQQSRDYGLESAKREMERRKLAAEQERRKGLTQATNYADYMNRNQQGLG